MAAEHILRAPSHPDGRAVDPIVARLRDSSLSIDERIARVALLGKTGAPRAAAILMELASSKDRHRFVAAFHALGSVGQAGQDALLVDALGDAARNVRLRAAISLFHVAASRTATIVLDRLERASEQDCTSMGISRTWRWYARRSRTRVRTSAPTRLRRWR